VKKSQKKKIDNETVEEGEKRRETNRLKQRKYRLKKAGRSDEV